MRVPPHWLTVAPQGTEAQSADIDLQLTFEYMQHASATLRKIFREAVRRDGNSAPLLAWPLACGAKTAERTHAINFAAGVLTVSVPDEAWRNQLQSFSSRYLAALNQVSPEPVNRIDFVTVKGTER